MSAINDGGPAFAQFEPDAWRNPRVTGGMTLRDYFAAKAMQGEIDSQGLEGREADHIAGMAYEMADAMLKAREVKP